MGLAAHDSLVSHARRYLQNHGFANIEVLDGINHRKGFHKPIPDLVATLEGKEVAIECGLLAESHENERIRKLMEAGYEIVIWFDYPFEINPMQALSDFPAPKRFE